MPDFHESLDAALERLEDKCECGFELDSFACRIRHIAVNYGSLRRERER